MICDYGGVYCEVCVYVLFCNGVSVCADVFVYLVLLNVFCFLSMGVGLYSVFDGYCACSLRDIVLVV